MRSRYAFSFGQRIGSGALRGRPLERKLIWMSAALNSLPANQVRVASSACMKSNCRFRLGSTTVAIPLAEIARAIGLAKNGIGAVAMRSKTSFISSGGIAEPSAKCNQYV